MRETPPLRQGGGEEVVAGRSYAVVFSFGPHDSGIVFEPCECEAELFRTPFDSENQKRRAMKDFEKIIGRQAITLVYFFTPQCAPCQLMEASLDEFERRMNGRVDIYRIDTYAQQAAPLLARYGIHSTPALLFFREGSLLWRNDGPMSYDELKAILEEIEEFEYEYIF